LTPTAWGMMRFVLLLQMFATSVGNGGVMPRFSFRISLVLMSLFTWRFDFQKVYAKLSNCVSLGVGIPFGLSNGMHPR